MTPRIARLRQQTLDTRPWLSAERAQLLTAFSRNGPAASVPVTRALAFAYLLEHKILYVGDDELIVGERGPAPKGTPTYPELCCHSLPDLDVLASRPKISYDVAADARRAYAEDIIPFWQGRSMRDLLFAEMTDEWKAAYEVGVFTEFMEQRAPGHTVLGDVIYRKGLLDLQREIEVAREALDPLSDPRAFDKAQQLQAMHIAAGAVVRFAQRHAELARARAAELSDPVRRAELERIAEVCDRVPAHAPRTFREALQAYWFTHLGVITELNTWDSFNPGRLDQHLFPFYQRDVEAGILTRDKARELLECFWIKFTNQPAPPKVGVTAQESGTYTDFANINNGGLTREGEDGVNDLTYLILDVIDEMRLLQPSSNIQLSKKNPDRFVARACEIVRQGWGQPSIFNADLVVEELVRQGKSLTDARQGGTSGCVETGAFGREAYILTGYLNLPKILELALNDGRDPRTGRQVGLHTGTLASAENFDQVFEAFRQQLAHVLEIKMRGSNVIERLFATRMPAPFLSVLIDDCIAKGRDYNDGGARYNTTYIMPVGIGTVTDSLSALKHQVFDRLSASGVRRSENPSGVRHSENAPGVWRLKPMVRPARVAEREEAATCASGSDGDGHITPGTLDAALALDFAGYETLRQALWHHTPRYGNDDERADALLRGVCDTLLTLIDGRPNTRGGEYHVNYLSTTCHVYFGSVTGATPDGRRAWQPVSDGISPVQGTDTRGPTAVLRSAAKMDHARTGGTLLNLKFAPEVLAGPEGIARLVQLVRAYFRLDGHHVQFNVVTADTLRAAQADPDTHRDLIVRVAGYSDYFCDLTKALQDEIIARTEHRTM